MMKKEFKVQSSKFKVTKKLPPFIIVFLLFTFYFSLFSSYADDLHSRSVVVMEASTGKILYAKNPDLKSLPASTTKLMTAILTIENADLGRVVTISKNASLTPPHKAGFKQGDKVTIEKLLYAALVDSANDAAVALAEAVAGSVTKFVELMNKKTKEIGALDTRFINPNGLPGPGQYITASDLAKIMNYALRYPKLREIIGTRVTKISTERGKTIFLKNTDRLLWSDDELVGGKTGYTRKARHCFVCAAEREQDTVIVAVLGSPSRSDLWKESAVLIDKGFDVLANKESPAVYVTKVGYTHVVKRHSHPKRVKKAKVRRDRKYAAKKAKRHHRKTVLTKKKHRVKAYATHKGRKKKNYGVAKEEEIAGNKG
jgi:D-alanyl-D-alanine carboxypeptidase (penicillin-binding protein 5/6)